MSISNERLDCKLVISRLNCHFCVYGGTDVELYFEWQTRRQKKNHRLLRLDACFSVVGLLPSARVRDMSVVFKFGCSSCHFVTLLACTYDNVEMILAEAKEVPKFANSVRPLVTLASPHAMSSSHDAGLVEPGLMQHTLGILSQIRFHVQKMRVCLGAEQQIRGARACGN